MLSVDREVTVRSIPRIEPRRPASTPSLQIPLAKPQWLPQSEPRVCFPVADLGGTWIRLLLFIDNDAVVQGRHIVTELLREPRIASKLLDQNVVCVNPGTGLGGCVAHVANDGTIETFTDGHLCEMRIHPFRCEGVIDRAKVTLETEPDGAELRLTVLRNGRRVIESLPVPGGMEAEALLSGTGIGLVARAVDRAFRSLDDRSLFGERAIDGHLVSKLIAQNGRSPEHRAAAFVAKAAGRAFAQLALSIHQGRTKKIAGRPEWSAEDRARLRGTSRFVMGGGVAAGPLGQRILEEARRSSPNDLQFFRAPNLVAEAGALGALSLIRPSVQQSTR